MANSRNNKAGNGKSNFGSDVSYADVKLIAGEKEAFLHWAKTGDVNCIDCLEALIADSYRVTVKVDYNNNSTNVSLTQQDNKHRNSGLVIISRSDNVDEALLLSFYKVFVLYEGQRLPTRDDNDTWG